MAGPEGTVLPDPPEAQGLWAWSSSLLHWLSARTNHAERKHTGLGPVARFRNVYISREAGAGGGTIARLVGTRMDWKVYDHELLEAIAHGMEIPAEEARQYDELAPSLVQDWLLPLREEHYAPQEAYLDHLAKLVESIGKAGQSIVVGRGAGHLLPRGETLNVRIISPMKYRARNLAARMGVSQRTARNAAYDRDRRAAKFVKTLHRVDIEDPHQYDLVLDSHSLGLTTTVDLIIRTVESGMPRPVPSAELV